MESFQILTAVLYFNQNIDLSSRRLFYFLALFGLSLFHGFDRFDFIEVPLAWSVPTALTSSILGCL